MVFVRALERVSRRQRRGQRITGPFQEVLRLRGSSDTSVTVELRLSTHGRVTNPSPLLGADWQ
jgi:hypothetical protein